MNTIKRLLAGGLCASMLLSVAACSENTTPPTADSGNSGGTATTSAATTTTTINTTDPNENAATDAEIKEIDTSKYQPSGNAGVVNYYGYYDITKDQKGQEQVKIFETDTYGGEIVWTSATFGEAYYEKLAALIAADDSPDLLTFEPQSFPYAVSKNMYEPLDEYFDIEDPIWEGTKDFIKSFEYQGKHYFFPHRIMPWYSLEYNRKTIEEWGLQDPYDLYKSGEWTWDTWRQLMVEFCNQSDDHIGYYATDATINAFVSTTGVVAVDYLPGGGVENNLNHVDVTRAVEYLAEMGRSGLLYPESHPHGDWVSPQVFATTSDKILFLGLEAEWSYIAMTENIQNKQGVENDILDTVSDFAFVPYPRDPNSDTYYQGINCFGYLIPKGAKNPNGSVEFIMCNRLYDTDETVQAQKREDHINPAKVTYTAGTYAGMQKWQMKWDPELYDLWIEMADPDKFEFVFEDLYGFGTEMQGYIGQSIINCTFGSESWAQVKEEVGPLVQALVDEYSE